MGVGGAPQQSELAVPQLEEVGPPQGLPAWEGAEEGGGWVVAGSGSIKLHAPRQVSAES